MSYEVIVVNRKTYTGNDAHYVGRPTILGNPFSEKQHGRDEAIARYKDWLNIQYRTNNIEVIKELKRLAKILKAEGRIVLSCWCAPKACHASVIGTALTNLIKMEIE